MKKNIIIKIISIIITLLAFAYIIKTFISYDISCNDIIKSEYILILIISIIVSSITIIISSYRWSMTLSFFSGKMITLKSSFYIYAKSNLGKYLPGKVALYVGRQLFGSSLGVSQLQLAFASIIEIFFVVISSLLVALILAWGKIFETISILFPSANIGLIITVLFLSAIALCVILYFIFRKKRFFIELLLKIKTFEFWMYFLRCVLFFTLNQFLISLVLSLFIYVNIPFEVSGFRIIMSAFVISWLIGFVIPGAPGGIGLREAVLILILSPFYKVEVILASALYQRIALIAGDVLAWAFSMIINRNNKSGV